MATKTLEELQEMLTEVLDVKEKLCASHATIRDSLRTEIDRLEALSELHCSGRWPRGYILNGQDLFNVMQCVQYVLLELQVDQADKIAEEIRQRTEG